METVQTSVEIVLVLPCLVALVIGFFVTSYFVEYSRTLTSPEELRRMSLEHLANGLKIDFKKLPNSESELAGIYGGFNLFIKDKYASVRQKGSEVVAATQIEMTSPLPVPAPQAMLESYKPGEPLSVQQISRRLLTKGYDLKPNGAWQINRGGREIVYYERGSQTSAHNIRLIAEVMPDLLRGIAVVVAIGGDAVPALIELSKAKRLFLSSIAEQTLMLIANDTEAKFKQQPQLLCVNCLASFEPRSISTTSWKKLRIYDCRLCHQTRLYGEEVIAVLDQNMSQRSIVEGKTIWVNCLEGFHFGDFTAIEIKHASDKEVERFVMNISNNADKRTKQNYKTIPCTISAECILSENSKRLLKSRFGEVIEL